MTDDSGAASLDLDQGLLTPQARLALDAAARLAAARGRRSPLGEEIAFAVLGLGRDDPSLTRFLDAQPKPIELDQLRAQLVVLAELGPHLTVAELDATYGAFCHALATARPASAATVLGTLLAMAYLSSSGRALLVRKGFRREALLEAGAGGAVPLALPSGGLDRPPPLGALLTPAGAPTLVGRGHVAAVAAERFRFSQATVLAGPTGAGKSVVARVAAAASRRPAVELNVTDLAVLSEEERAKRVASLVRWLRLFEAGLVINDVHRANMALLASLGLPDDLPLLITVSEDVKRLTLPQGRAARRLKVAPPTLAQTRAAIAAWARESGWAPIEGPVIERAIALVDRYFGEAILTPGAVIELLREAAPEAKDGSRPILTEDSLEEALAAMLRLPRALVVRAERARLNSLVARLSERVIGQLEAIEATARALRRAAMELDSKPRPIGSFLFVGPTGVGKTELARALARLYFGSDEALLKYNMGDYQLPHQISQFIGAPPGYIGHDKPGQLAKDLADHAAGAVLLLDEIERADNAVEQYLLALLDDGVMVDAHGVRRSLRNVIVIMTSNLGAREAAAVEQRGRIGFGQAGAGTRSEAAAEVRSQAVSRHFAPEFRGRVDAVIEFAPLRPEDIALILDLAVAAFRADLQSAKRVDFVLGPRLRAQLLQDVLADGLGARPLAGRFRREVMDRMVDAFLADEAYRVGATYTIELDGDDEPVVSRTERSRPSQGTPRRAGRVLDA